MLKQPPWSRAAAIETVLEVAHTLIALDLDEDQGVVGQLCTMRHVGALVELAMVATKDLADELCDVADKLDAQEESPAAA